MGIPSLSLQRERERCLLRRASLSAPSCSRPSTSSCTGVSGTSTREEDNAHTVIVVAQATPPVVVVVVNCRHPTSCRSPPNLGTHKEEMPWRNAHAQSLAPHSGRPRKRRSCTYSLRRLSCAVGSHGSSSTSRRATHSSIL